ncbi:cytochrome-c peroxidase [Pseudobacteriovorax antillogorgiicola]|uniref:Methylamine utilization protein MauG n=1 Tax=Pseudobacteriovorax antillogorgiicola TaxID=1513793 RepID=A0A1Y6CLJ2_9BACT|nr:cytochrome c peroxidase [Pseudobacteriovorax antillogorgiicola]TCS47325.1 cytochrome c peroxidase [Pseudobacteriovorax antillogorgiicola]SMF62847.1 cytochrome c peroxidase [Pseudobacteriovorax antillogorgiicola]
MINILSILMLSSLLGTSVSLANMDALKKDFQRPDSIPFPDDNQYSAAKYKLGWTLFFDPRLSTSDFISCASCHNPGLAWGDGMATATGHGMNKLGRRTPTILNLAWGELMMWDGREDSLESQALGPIQAAGEMNMPLDTLLPKLKAIAGYGPLFKAAFGDSEVTADRIGKAIATYERKVVSGQAPFDNWIKGDDDAISDSAKRGFALFNGKANCAVCHSGWRFTDDGFHDIGVNSDDLGRGKILEIEELNHTFKTPTLRNVDQRAPYTHNGSEKTLIDIIDLYNEGGRIKRPTVSEEVRELGLNRQEKVDLVEFLKSLTSDDPAMSIPTLPH